MRRAFSIILSLFFFLSASSQIDSLKRTLSSEQADSTLALLNTDLAFLFYQEGNHDSTLKYLSKAVGYADVLIDNYKSNKSLKCLEVAESVYHNNSKYFFRIEKYDIALESYKKELELLYILNDQKMISVVSNMIGNIYKYSSKYELAIDYYQQSIKVSEKIDNKHGISVAHIGIANVFINWGNMEKALEHYNASYNISLSANDTIIMANAKIGSGNVYQKSDSNSMAIEAYNYATELFEAIDDQEGIALALLNMADVYSNNEQYDNALNHLFKALDIVEMLNNKIRVTLILYQVGNIYLNKGEYEKALTYFKKSLLVAKEVNYRKIELSDYESIAITYELMNDYENACDYNKRYQILKDTIFNENTHQQISELETKYETEKKEQEIINQKAINTHQKRQLLMSTVGALVILIFLILMVLQYIQKRKANIILAQQKKEIEDIHYEISESINYAKRLQNAVLPQSELLDKYLSDHFILFKPKDKVSGDFYWWTHFDHITVIAVADCTGHGVPGAFMSMLGISYLREIVQKEHIVDTGVVLNRLREEIINVLKQHGEVDEQKDGMDMAVIFIDHQAQVIKYSGANNPLYLITKEPRVISGAKVFDDLSCFYEFKPDKMPIAIYDKMSDFKTNELRLKTGDQLYMFSDGFVDQFGGVNELARQTGGKKFKYKKFRRLLSENSHKPMQAQKERLDTAFEDWKGSLDQIDDVVIVGLKI